MKGNLEDAIALAVEAHRGQRDKSGRPYILHPLRLMFKMSTENEMITAVLHDVVEDSETTIFDLKNMGFSSEILEAVDCLTQRENESYAAFINRAKSNPTAKKVKTADLEDNMDIRRLDVISDKSVERLRKYHRTWIDLTERPGQT